MASCMLAQDRRNASAKADRLSSRIMSAGDFRPRRATRGVAPTVREFTCRWTWVLVRKVLSRCSRRSASKPPKVRPIKPPTAASTGAFEEDQAADGLARETTVELEVMNAGSAAVSSALFSKPCRTVLINSALPSSCLSPASAELTCFVSSRTALLDRLLPRSRSFDQLKC